MMDVLKKRAVSPAVVSALLFIPIATFGGCDQTSGTSGGATGGEAAVPASGPIEVAQPTSVKSPAVEGPQIEFAALDHDFGDIWDVGSQMCEFEFTNIGSKRLNITMVKPGCGCTTTKLAKKLYEPGESGSIEVQFNPLGTGRQTKGITVMTNSNGVAQHKLTISSNITPFVTVAPRYLSERTQTAKAIPSVELGQSLTRSFTFTSPDPNLTVRSVTTSGMQGQWVTARMLEPGEDRVLENGRVTPVMPGEFAVEVTVLPEAPWGAIYAAIEVNCLGTLPGAGGPVEHTATCNLATSVWGQLAMSDNMLRVGVVPPGGAVDAEITLTHREGRPFNVLEAKIEQAIPPMTIEVVPVPGSNGSSYRLRAVGESGRYLGQTRGTAVVRTDVPGEEIIRFRVAGMVRTVAKKSG